MNRQRRGMALVLVVAGAATSAACGLGDVGDPTLPPSPPPGEVKVITKVPAPEGDCIEPACQVFPLPTTAHLFRLSNAQWERTVQDLLKLDNAPGNSVAFPSDPVAKEFGSEASALKVNGAGWKQYRNAAEA